MATITLTQAVVDCLQCPRGKKKVEYVDANRTGLYIAVTPSTANYYLRYKKADGKTGHIKLGSTATMRLSEARQQVTQLKRDIAAGKHNVSEKVPTFADFFTDHYLNMAMNRKRSWKKDLSMFEVRLKDKFGKTPINKLSRRAVMEFHNELLEEEKLAPATCDHHLKLMRRILNWAIEIDIISENPLTRIPLFNADNKVENYLQPDELQRLMHVLNTHPNKMTCNVMKFLLSTGARLNEALQSKWSHINREKRVWTIPSTNTKSKRLRSVPLNDYALEVLNSLGTEEHIFLFMNFKTGTHLKEIHTGWDNIRKQADLPKLRIHDLRHSYASMLVNGGRTLYEVQQILGHSVPIVTQRYAHLSTKTLLSASDTASAFINEAMARTG